MNNTGFETKTNQKKCKLRDTDIWFLNKIKSSIDNFDLWYKDKKVKAIILNRKRFGNSKYQLQFEEGSKKWVSPNDIVYHTKVGERKVN